MSCLPCNDIKECNDLQKTSISAKGQHQGHNHSAETCTPFCICSCCAVSPLYYSIIKTPATGIEFLPGKHPLQDERVITDVYFAIWQPPQLTRDLISS